MKTDKCINHQFCFLRFLHDFLKQQIPVRKDTKLITIKFINKY